MGNVTADEGLVGYCGLYCGACRRHPRGKCPGCHDNTRATWCTVRSCNLERHTSSCAECKDYEEVRDCKKFNNAVSRLVGLALRSNRPACIEQIKVLGLEGHAERMANLGRHSVKR